MPWSIGYHPAIDLVCKDDSPVLAIMPGKVVRSRHIDGWGRYVTILQDDGLSFTVAHLSAQVVWAGDRVEKGQVIGIVGSTGGDWGIHAHCELRTNGADPHSNIDIAAYLGIENKIGLVKIK